MLNMNILNVSQFWISLIGIDPSTITQFMHVEVHRSHNPIIRRDIYQLMEFWVMNSALPRIHFPRRLQSNEAWLQNCDATT